MTALPNDLIPPALAIDGDEPFPVQMIDLIDTHEDMPEVAAVHAWSIEDDGAAEWAMAHVAQIQANIDAVNAQAAAYRERIERWHDAMTARLRKRSEFFETHLIAYADAFRARDPKRNKTLHLPSGTVSSTESRPAVIVTDDTAAAEWAQRLPDEVRDAVVQTTTKVMVVPFRQHVHVGEKIIGYRADLECGHDTDLILPADANGEPVDLSGTWPCYVCDEHPIDGPPARQITTVHDVTALVVRDGDGNEVPGADVRPGGVTFKVRPA